MTRTTIEFRRNLGIERAIHLDCTLPNVVVGQVIAFDHPTTSECLNGRVDNIQHVVFLDKPPVTYIDVTIEH